MKKRRKKLKHGGLVNNNLKREVGTKGKREEPRLEYFTQIIKDRDCRIVREVKKRGIELSVGRWWPQTSHSRPAQISLSPALKISPIR